MRRCLHPTCLFPNKRICPATYRCPEFHSAIHVRMPDPDRGGYKITGLTLKEAMALQVELSEEIGRYMLKEKS